MGLGVSGEQGTRLNNIEIAVYVHNESHKNKQLR